MSSNLADWKTCRLDELATIKRGASPRPIQDPRWFAKSGHGWVRISDVTRSDRVLRKTTQYLSDEGRAASVEISPGDLIMSICATIGRPLFSSINACIHDGFVAFKNIRLERIDPDYLYHFLKMNEAHFDSLSQPGTQKNLNSKLVGGTEILLPPLDEQRRIVEVVRSADEAVAANQLAVRQNDLVLKKSMDAALHISSGAPPAHWKVVRINELGRVKAGRQRSPSFTNGTVRRYLRVANVFDGYIDLSDVLAMPFTEREFAEYRLLPGDILLNEGQSLHLVGRAAIYEGAPEDCCFQNTLVRFRAEAVSPMFAYALMRTLYWAGQFSAIATQTTSVAHLGVSRFANLRVSLPSEKEQEEIASAFRALSSASQSLQAAGRRLSEVRKALATDLLSGRVRVPA